MKKLTLFVWACLAVSNFGMTARAQKGTVRKPVPAKIASSDRVRDGLNGPVRRVRVETAKIVIKDGKPVEGLRLMWGTTNYDESGRKIDTVANPGEGGALKGKKTYHYDDRGNIIEMVLRSGDGSILRQEIYKYEFDKLGNWKRMTASVAVDEDGKLSFEPTQVTYRTITYYHIHAIDHTVTASAADGAAVSGQNAKRTTAPTLKTLATKEAAVLIGPDGKKSENKTPTISVDLSEHKVRSTISSRENKKPSTSDGASSRSGSDAVASLGTTSETGSVAPSTASSPKAASFYNEGLSYLTSGRYPQAVEALRQAVHLYPENAIAYSKLGLAYSALHKYKEAVASFKMAIRIKAEVVDAEAYYRLGEACSVLGKHSEGLEAFKQAMYIARAQTLEPDPSSYQGFPTPSELHYGLGFEYHNLGRDDEAITELKEATALNPRFAEAYYGLAVAYITLGDRKSAEQQEKILRPLNAALADRIVRSFSLFRGRPPGVTEGNLGTRARP
jgi:tetratricopeptide (TPR) repeat protein